jgi:hypothetical protein
MKRPLLAGLVLGFAFLCATYEVSSAQEVDENGDLIPVVEKPPDPLANMKLIGSYLLTIVGAVVIGMAVVKTYSSSLSYPSQKVMLTNFLRTNPYQLIVMEKRSKGTIAEPVIAALKVGGMMGPIDLKTIQQGTLPTYEAMAKSMVAHFGTTMTKCKMAVTAAGAGAMVALTAGRYLPVVIGVLAGIGFIRIYLFKGELESQVIRGRAELLPEVDNAVATGRYHVPFVPPA